MSGILRASLLAVVVTAIVWVCVIGYWRSSGATPGTAGIVFFLVVLPAGLLATVWGVRRMRARRRLAAESAPADTAGATAEVDPEPVVPALDVLAASVRLPFGDGPGALAALPRPGLHPRLRDRDGLPVFAAFVDDLDTGGVEAALAGPADALRPTEETWRALALLEPVAEELFSEAAALMPPLPQAEERVVAGLRRTERIAVERVVDIRVLVPAAWSRALREAVAAWLAGLATDCGLDQRRMGVECTAAETGGDTLALLETMAHQGERWQLLLACSSLVGERAVQRLMAAGQLMRGGRLDGDVPGEGAAGLLLRPQNASTQPLGTPLARLQGLLRMELDPAASPRAQAGAGAGLLERVMAAAGVEPADVVLVASDADHRREPVVEAVSAAQASCPDLDATDACPALGTATGRIDFVAPLALLALASQQVGQASAPVLALAGMGTLRRTAVAGVPPSSDETPQQSGSTPALTA